MNEAKQLARKIISIEKEVEKYWKQNNIIMKTLERRGKKFYFLDGPPYVTGSIHIGTAWNKILKDAILRYKRMCGYRVWSIPGYDTHGLPIETTVEKTLGIKSKKEIVDMGIGKFNQKCKELVINYINVQTNQFKKLCVWMDWKNHYATYTNDYISRVWYIIKKAFEKNLLGKDLRVFHWCPRCQTVLSEHEVAIGYKDKQSPSIYVKFPLIDKKAHLLIWTTTPWTLPSNVAVMVHPDRNYLLVKLSNGENVILMEDRVEEVLNDIEFIIVDRFIGRKLEGWKYQNPLEEFVDAQKELKDRRIVLSSQYVSAEEGSGLVHVAPSHGKEDFDVAREYDLPIISVVDDNGKFTEKSGKYSGLNVFEADEIIIKDLKEKKALYKHTTIVHKYPHCWRCKTPLILRITRQWVIYLSKLRDNMISENKKILWIPQWAGEDRFGKWLETARDWVISRQRYWGTPIPIWKCNKCGHIKVIGSKQELESLGYKLVDLHRPYIDGVILKCEKCNSNMKRVPDVLDVWIDAGAASWASIGFPDNKDLFYSLWPVDFIVEGHDQTRGWFYALLALGILVFDETPYKTVLMHGFTLDEEGRAMHKSLGNVILPEEIIERYGTDVFRAFVLNHPPWEDLRVSFKKLDDTLRVISILLNTFEFFDIYASIDNFEYDEEEVRRSFDRLPEEDKWIISLFERILKNISKEMDKYHIHIAIREVLKFIVDNLSREYIKLIRRRVWIEEEGWIKNSAYLTLYYILNKITRILSLFVPHLSEYLYINVLKKYDKKLSESVHLDNWPIHNKDWIDVDLIDGYSLMWDVISSIDSIRYSTGIKRRQPLSEVLLEKNMLNRLSKRQIELIKEMGNVLNIKSFDRKNIHLYLDLKAKTKLDVLGPIFKKKLSTVKYALENLDSKTLWRLRKEREVKIYIENIGEVNVTEDILNLELISKYPYKYSVIGSDYIFLNTKIDKELLLRGLAKDIVRRIQVMRKDVSLDVMDNIFVYMYTDNKEVIESLKKYYDYIANEVRAVDLLINTEKKVLGYEKDWEINDYKVKIVIIKKED